MTYIVCHLFHNIRSCFIENYFTKTHFTNLNFIFESLIMATILDEEDYYPMNHKHRGRAIVINNQAFDPKTGLNFRRGSEVDARHIARELQRLEFDVNVFHNLKKREMVATLLKGELNQL